MAESISPLSAVFGSVVVLAADFDGVFVGVVFNGGGVWSVVARCRCCANNGSAAISIDHTAPAWALGAVVTMPTARARLVPRAPSAIRVKFIMVVFVKYVGLTPDAFTVAP